MRAREDVGRHNAADAIAGYMWLDAVAGGDKVFYTTGRLTSEMVINCAGLYADRVAGMAGIDLEQTGLIQTWSKGLRIPDPSACPTGAHRTASRGCRRPAIGASAPCGLSEAVQ